MDKQSFASKNIQSRQQTIVNAILLCIPGDKILIRQNTFVQSIAGPILGYVASRHV